MKVLIIGAGAVGFALAQVLTREGEDVTVVEIDPARVAKISETLDITVMNGYGASPAVLEEAGVRSADMVIAVTPLDEVNLIAGIIAHSFGVKRTIARVRNPEFSDPDSVLNTASLGIDLIVNPDAVTVGIINKLIDEPYFVESAEFESGRILTYSFKLSSRSPFVGKTLSEVRALAEDVEFVVLAVTHNGETTVPRGDTVFKARDQVLVILLRESHHDFMKILGSPLEEVKRVVIYGASSIGYDVAMSLVGVIENLVLIEEDEAAAQVACENLPGSILVLGGKPTDDEILNEARMDKTDVFIALSDSDEANLISALFAKKRGAHHVIVLSREPEYMSILDQIGVDVIVNPRLCTAAEITRFVRTGQILELVKFRQGDAEAIEVEVAEGCRAAGRQVKEIPWPEGSLVSIIACGDDFFIPGGDTVLEPGCKAIVFALPTALSKIEKLFCP